MGAKGPGTFAPIIDGLPIQQFVGLHFNKAIIQTFTLHIEETLETWEPSLDHLDNLKSIAEQPIASLSLEDHPNLLVFPQSLNELPFSIDDDFCTVHLCDCCVNICVNHLQKT